MRLLSAQLINGVVTRVQFDRTSCQQVLGSVLLLCRKMIELHNEPEPEDSDTPSRDPISAPDISTWPPSEGGGDETATHVMRNLNGDFEGVPEPDDPAHVHDSGSYLQYVKRNAQAYNTALEVGQVDDAIECLKQAPTMLFTVWDNLNQLARHVAAAEGKSIYRALEV